MIVCMCLIYRCVSIIDPEWLLEAAPQYFKQT